MSQAVKTGIARRPLLASIGAVLGLGAAGAFVYEAPRLFGRRYPRTKFDDLLDQVPDRESAARLGRAAMAQLGAHNGTGPHPGAKKMAQGLRNGPGKGSLARATEVDVKDGRVMELQGWVLPLSVVFVSMIAAEVQPAPDAA
jgi:hypothetical protein